MFGLRSARSRAIFGCLVVLAFGISMAALASTTAATDQTGRTTLWLTIGLSVAAFVVVAGVPVLVVSVLRPLAALRASARAIAAGDPEARAKVSGPEEVASLAHDFNAMTDALTAKAQEYIDTTNLTRVTILRVDKDNRVSLVNDAMCEFLGKSREEILGTPIVDYLHPEDAPSTIRTVLNMVQSKGLVTGIVSRYVTPRGTRVVEWNGYPIFDEEGRYAGVHGTGRDITERKRAEEALRESEKRYRLLAENATDVIWTMDTNLRFTYMSPSVTRLRGYTVEEAMAQTLEETLTPASFKVAMKTVAKEWAIEQMEEKDLARWLTLEMENTCKDGSTVWFEVKIAFLHDEDKRPVGIVGVSRDISERKQAEAALREEKERAQKYLDVAEVILVVLNREAEAALINQKGCTVLGYDEQEIIGKNWFDAFLPPGVREETKAVFGKLMAGEIEPVEYRENRVLTKSGEQKLIAWHNTVMTDGAGNIVGTLSSGEDITERKRAEEALRESESRYRLLAENATDVIWTMDTNLRMTYVSPSVTRLRGYTVQEVMGQTVKEMVTPASLHVVKKAIAAEEAIEESKGKDLSRSPTVEVEQTCKDGSTVWVEAKFAILRDPDGQAIGTLGISRDISERKRAEEALRESEQSYRELTDSIADVFFAMDRDLKYVYWNKASEHLTGILAEDAIGRSLYEVFPEVKGTNADKLYQEVLRTQQPRSLVDQYQLAGKDFFFEISAYPSGTGLSVFVKDISERKRAEEALRQSEERLKILFESAPDAYYLHDLEGNFVDGNRAAEELTGYKKEELIGKTLFESNLFPPEQLPKAAATVAKLLRGLPTGPDEFTLIRKGGKHIAVETRGFLVKIRAQTLVLGIARDISERKRAEEALRESEEKYRRVVQDSIDGILIAQGLEMKFVNPALLEMFGYQSEEEMVGHPFTDFIPPEYRELLVERGYAREKGQDEPEQYEYKALRKDGSEFDAEISVTRITYQGKPARQGIVRDVTERKRAEEALRESEERYRSLVETSPDAIILSDLNTNIIMLNERAVRLLGYDNAEEVIGRNSLDFIAPEDRQRAAENALRTLQTGATQSVEYTLLRADGTSFPAELSASSIVDAQGRPQAFTGVVRDITDRKRAEEALQKARENIESRVERRVQEVNGYRLTFRELTVLHLVAAGESDKEIATVLGISPLTAHKHLANILDKMGAASRTEAGVRALREGLLD